MVAAAAETSAQQDEEEYFGPQGLRIARYRAPTPRTVPRGQTVVTAELQDMLRRETLKPILIDVQVVVVRPEAEEFGMSWLPGEERYHIPGSTWLPNVGYGRLSARVDRYFRANLERLSGGDRTRAIVIYCVVDCWMSWNAVQRAAEYGYRNLYWYRGGTDAWAAAGLPLVAATPQPLE